jgi:hypothetical protein
VYKYLFEFLPQILLDVYAEVGLLDQMVNIGLFIYLFDTGG